MVHMGTRYAGGFRLQTVGPPKEIVEGFFNDHLFCGHQIELQDEHFDPEYSFKEIGVVDE